MESLKKALRCQEGRSSLIGMAVGILVACLGGYLLRDYAVICDIAVLAGSLFSVVGVERFCRLIIAFRDGNGPEA